MASEFSASRESSVDMMDRFRRTSSPAQPEGKSFASRAMTEDGDTQMADATPEPAEKSFRGKAKGSQLKEANQQQQIGKIRHLKKEDGEPLWRVDIQYDFLKAVFDNELAVFTNSYDETLPKQNFADLYIDTMSRSTKTSKVLRDKLLSDREAAKGMAMVCLLVNVGRMNTTLNCEQLILAFASRTNSSSLSRNASPATNVPRYSVPTGPPRQPRLQAASRRTSTQIHLERRRGRS